VAWQEDVWHDFCVLLEYSDCWDMLTGWYRMIHTIRKLALFDSHEQGENTGSEIIFPSRNSESVN